MASLKEIKVRINSVKNTLKITSAMKLVASAKLHRAQGAIEGMLPYSENLTGIINHLLNHSEQGLSSPFIGERPVKRVAVVAISSSTSLCGGFNSNAIRLAENTLKEYAALGKDNLTLFPIGRKMVQAFASSDMCRIVDDFALIGEKPRYNEAAGLAERLMQMYLDGEVDRIELLYTHYKNMAVQVLMRETFLPVEVKTTDRDPQEEITDYLIEPAIGRLSAMLVPKALAIQIFSMLLDSSAAEHAARTFAMQQATDNGESILQELNLTYNKGRQQAITNELLDIISGQAR